jgi:hypothetical protein
LHGKPEAERMWVEVESIDQQGGFTGRLTNMPAAIPDLTLGDLIVFKDVHILNTQHDNDDNVVNKYMIRCYASMRILVDNQRVGYLYREPPDNDHDSGWRIMAGDESQDYIDDPKNTMFVSLGAVLNHDDSIIELLNDPVGSEYERRPGSTTFVKI